VGKLSTGGRRGRGDAASADVILMDSDATLDGIEATRRIVSSNLTVRVLMLNSCIYDSLRAGASGFMLKDAPPEEIAGAVRIPNGESLLAPSITRSVIEEFVRHPSHSSTEGQS
jgi:DNA-binding NarL/FixJ family response regulator